MSVLVYGKAKEWYIYGELDDFQKIGKYTAIVSVYVNLAKKMKKLHISILGGSPNKKERERIEREIKSNIL